MGWAGAGAAVISKKNYFILLLYKYIIKIKIPLDMGWAGAGVISKTILFYFILLYKYIIKGKIPVAIWAAVRAVVVLPLPSALASWSSHTPSSSLCVLSSSSWSLCVLSSSLSLLLLTFLATQWGHLAGFRAGGGGGGGDSGGGQIVVVDR